MGDTKAEAPTLATTPRRGRRVHAGPDWKQMGPPCQVPDIPGGVRGGGWLERNARRRGSPTQGANPGQRCGPRAGLKTPPERQGRQRPSGSRELGEAVKEGQGP